MQIRSGASLTVLLLSALACGTPPQAPAEPLLDLLPPTPDPPFSTGSEGTVPTSQVPTGPANPLFSGSWGGIDPDDGSTITVSLTQSANTLTGILADKSRGVCKTPKSIGEIRIYG